MLLIVVSPKIQHCELREKCLENSDSGIRPTISTVHSQVTRSSSTYKS